MIDRIKRLMKEKNLSATQFSEEVGIQRSALSHVLSGRNKPSLDFMMKVKNQYPEIELDWLLLGKGKMIREEEIIRMEESVDKIETGTQPELKFKTEEEDAHSSEEDVKNTEMQIGGPKSKVKIRHQFHDAENQPSYIILMYDDNTFDTYTPKQ